MEFNYTSERSIQIVIALMKAHNVKKVIASPGATDVAIVASLQQDTYFQMYSCIDERSAAYMGCGMAAECGEPVAIICTGATSFRNYMPGLTEAYYRQLPVLAITCCRSKANVGHYVDQVTDSSVLPNDIAMESVHVQTIHSSEDEWDVMIKVNKAILGLTRNGGGPCHINLETVYSTDFSVKEFAPVRVLKRYYKGDSLPSIPNGKIGVFVGAHGKWSDALTNAVDLFCEVYDAVVLCDLTSNYKGKYGVILPLIAEQMSESVGKAYFDMLIHIGNISNISFKKAKVMWRVNPDGEIRDTFRTMNYVFQMSEVDFFNAMTIGKKGNECDLIKQYRLKYQILINSIPELPFSNMWVAKEISNKIPAFSVLHTGIRNTVRSWGYFDLPKTVMAYCNTGGFGIDGGISSLIGASMVDKNRLYFGVYGDLLFYYDMNSLGNRDISSNVRIMIINNGLGQEFKNYTCFSSMFGDEADKFISAKGHFLNGGVSIIKPYVESLGFKYISASSKDEFYQVYEQFISSEIRNYPIIFEVFTKTEDETKAHEIITTLSFKSKTMKLIKQFLSKPEMKYAKCVVKKVRGLGFS